MTGRARACARPRCSTCRSRLMAERPMGVQRPAAPARAMPSSTISAACWHAWRHTASTSDAASWLAASRRCRSACMRRPGHTGDGRSSAGGLSCSTAHGSQRSTRALACTRAPWVRNGGWMQGGVCPQKGKSGCSNSPCLARSRARAASVQAGGRRTTSYANKGRPRLGGARARARAPAGARAARRPRATRAWAAPPG